MSIISAMNSRKISLTLVFVLGFVFDAQAHEAHSKQDAIVDFIQEMVTEHQFSEKELIILMDDAKRKDGILNAFDKPATSKPWRKLAAEIGETAAGVSDIRRNGGARHRMSLFSNRLGFLFSIRLELYKKKFFMKFLNFFFP